MTKLEIYDTSCGGQVLVRAHDGQTENWEFDDTDQLVNVLVERDSLHTCYEGGRSRSWLYGGEPCQFDASSKVDACAAQGGAGGAPGVGPGVAGAAGATP